MSRTAIDQKAIHFPINGYLPPIPLKIVILVEFSVDFHGHAGYWTIHSITLLKLPNVQPINQLPTFHES